MLTVKDVQKIVKDLISKYELDNPANDLVLDLLICELEKYKNVTYISDIAHNERTEPLP